MKKKTIALLMTVAMAATLCSCGSQPETILAEDNQTEDSESLDDEIDTADERSTDDTEEENTNSESEDSSEDSIVRDSDDAEESDEDEGSESYEDKPASFDLGFMSFELPEGWDMDDYASSSEDEEYAFAQDGDIFATGIALSIMRVDIDEEPELVSMLFESEDAVLEEYLDSELTDENLSQSFSIKDLRQTFIGKTREISIEMSDSENEYSIITYLGLNNDNIYGISLTVLHGFTEEDVDVQDGMAAVDMLFETGKLLK